MQNQINQIIKERRSHYPQEFTGNILDADIINILLQNANWAPNHTLNYPWRFKILTQASLTAWIEKAIELYKADTPTELQKSSKLTKLEAYKTQISHSIAIVLQHNEIIKHNAVEDISAVACAVQNIYLSLSQYPHAAGYWSTGLGTYSSAMHQYLGLEPNQQLMGFFILGHIETKRTESNRKSIENFLLI